MSEDLRTYVVGLGANLGDRRSTLKSAALALQAHGSLLALSALYESRAMGPPQPDYLNAAVLLQSALSPLSLLKALLAIEQAHGRERRERWGPRTLDLDLLFSPGLMLSEPELTLPHPGLEDRAFALAPLADVSPAARDPASGRLYAARLLELASQDLRRIGTAADWSPSRTE